MESLDLKLIIFGGIAYILRDTWILTIKSLIQYLMRGEHNLDNNFNTADIFDHFNPNDSTFSRRYITKYTLFGVHWGFFREEGYVECFSWWFEWAADRKNRFKVPMPIGFNNIEDFLKDYMRRR